MADDEQRADAPVKPKKKSRSRRGGIPGAQASQAGLLILINLALMVLIVLLLNWFEIIDIEPYITKLTTKKREAVDPLAKKEDELKQLMLKHKEELHKFRQNAAMLALLKKQHAEQKRRLKQELEDLRKKEKKIDRDKQRTAHRREKIEAVVEDLYNMPPEKAVERILLWKDAEIALFLEAHDIWAQNNEKQSLRSYYLQLMPKDRAAKVLELIREKPLENEQTL
jgi:hypothetical protein